MSRQDKIDCANHGTYYSPATKHYGSRYDIVVCDGCGKKPLTSCYGLGNCDLCMNCRDELKTKSYERALSTHWASDERRPISTPVTSITVRSAPVISVPVIHNPFILEVNMETPTLYGIPFALGYPASRPLFFGYF
jgi:hypothetical protein